MKKYPFSINIDECTSNNSQKILYILVSYLDIEIGESVVQHYESVSLIEVNAKSLLERICNCFTRDSIPFQNLVLKITSDSVNGIELGWFTNYLFNRKVQVMHDKCLSGSKLLFSCVPHGSI